MCAHVYNVATNLWTRGWSNLKDKKEKKTMLKALVYLDALITLHRMPAIFEFSITELTLRFRGVKEKALELILQKFCTISTQDLGEQSRQK